MKDWLTAVIFLGACLAAAQAAAQNAPQAGSVRFDFDSSQLGGPPAGWTAATTSGE